MSDWPEGTAGHAITEALARIDAALLDGARAIAATADPTGLEMQELAFTVRILGAARVALEQLMSRLETFPLRRTLPPRPRRPLEPDYGEPRR